jgi:hypothetical protein
MRLYDSILRNALRSPDGEAENLVLGWKGSFLSIKDGRWGLGALPPAGEPLSPREDHTRNILSCRAHGLARLLVSPYPQEFSAASAALAALSPAGHDGKPLEYLLPLPSGENVSLLAPDPWVVDFLRDWNWNISIFDDFSRGVNVFPEWTSFQHLHTSNWIWFTAETLRNRRILSLIPILRQKKGVILQGPGIPFLPSVFLEAGVTHLVLPVSRLEEKEETRRYIAAGGTPWNCPSLLWKVFPLLYTERMPS